MNANGKPVFVVDDDPAIRRMLSTCLKLEGFHAVELSSGKEALRYAEENPPLAVILDVLMPEIDGYDLCKRLRKNPKTSSTVILLISSLPTVDSRVQGLQIGADDFITKPFDPEELIARLRAHLRRMGAQNEKEKILEQLAEDLAQANKRLQEEASTDSLTGLLNRRQLWRQFEEEYQRAKRFGRPLAFVLLDLDRFKEINDQYGHPVGDKMLQDVAHFLKTHLRTIDSIARYGGEEFAVLLPETPRKHAATVIDRLRREYVHLIIPPLSRGKISWSAGVSAFPEDGETLQQLYEKADQALYIAKAHGRNRVATAV